MSTNNLIQQSAEYAEYLEEWLSAIPSYPIEQVCTPAEHTAILSVDLINGFCSEGPLASPRVAGIVPSVVDLFKRAYAAGARNFVLIQDTHEPDAVEFSAYPAHCVSGSHESQTVEEILQLPFSGQLSVIHKNSIDPFEYTTLSSWVGQNPAVNTFIVVGDCTDICVYQLAIRLKAQANARQIKRRVIVPVGQVQTYDSPVKAARAAGIISHPGDLLHAVFLNHMALNAIEIACLE